MTRCFSSLMRKDFCVKISHCRNNFSLSISCPEHILHNNGEWGRAQLLHSVAKWQNNRCSAFADNNVWMLSYCDIDRYHSEEDLIHSVFEKYKEKQGY